MSNIIIPQDMSDLNNQRNQLKRAQEDARGKATTLNNLAGQIPPPRGPAPFMSPITMERTPPAEVAAVLPLLQQQLSQAQQFAKSIQDNRNQIQHIQQDARTLKMIVIITAIILVVILIFVLLHAAHVF